ncbi:MAG: UvrB/UvrC motif-containing protein, partial [Cohnella sp.]|nr:UvrB/UvrC motif-containing protein [Cohnella sp.]
LDADKEGFLRSERSLIQTIGRAARNSEGRVIMYGDQITESMEKAIGETERRRAIQMAYNEKHGITPQTIRKKVRDVIEATKVAEQKSSYLAGKDDMGKLSKKERLSVIERLEAEMKEAAKSLQFERAAELRDALLELKAGL